MKEFFKTVGKQSEAELVEKRSRFIATVRRVESEEEALAFIDSLRQKYWDARHNVYAYIIENNNIMRFTDDGEPSGTAGKPVLEVLKNEGLSNTAVVVTRYFGGILLGTGGLVHAYSKTAKLGVDAAGIVRMMLCRKIVLRFEYPMLGKLQSELFRRDIICDEPVYTDKVEIAVYIPVSETEKFKADITELTNASVAFTDGRVSYKAK